MRYWIHDLLIIEIYRRTRVQLVRSSVSV
eukprot:COSAG01_NODE_55252_length_326_cov_1.030837_1_plen_28_part_01